MNFILVHFLLFIFIVSCLNFCQSTNASDGSIRINKCCEPHEILVDLRCTDVNDTKTKEGIVLALYAFREIFFFSFVCFFNFLIFYSFLTEPWSPIFTGADGMQNIQVPSFWFAVGIPQCGQKQMWPIYHYPTVSLLK